MADQRISHRITTRISGTIANLATHKTTSGIIEDLSALGIRVLIEEAGFVGVGEEIEIFFIFLTLDDDEEDVHIKGLVRKVFDAKDGRIPVGVQFRDEKPQMKKVVEAWLTLMFEQKHHMAVIDETQVPLYNILLVSRALAIIDGAFQDVEKRVFLKLLSAFAVKYEDFEQYTRGKSVMETLQSLATQQEKELLMDAMTVIACADGVFDAAEQAFVAKVMEKVGLAPAAYPLTGAEAEGKIAEICHHLDEFLDQIKTKVQALPQFAQSQQK